MKNVTRKKGQSANFGRPTVFTPTVLQKLEHAFSVGATDREACSYAEIAESSLYNYQATNSDFLERKTHLKTAVLLKARKTIIDAIEKGDIGVSKWYLERVCPIEFGSQAQRDKLLIVGNSSPSPFANYSDEEMIKEIESSLAIIKKFAKEDNSTKSLPPSGLPTDPS